MAKVLTHGQRIKIPGINWATTITFHIDHWQEKDEYGWEETLEHYNDRNSCTDGMCVFTVNAGHMITADYPGKAEKMARDKAEFDASEMLTEGEEVEIEGKLYKVHIVGRQYSDPVHFIKL